MTTLVIANSSTEANAPESSLGTSLGAILDDSTPEELLAPASEATVIIRMVSASPPPMSGAFVQRLRDEFPPLPTAEDPATSEFHG